MRLLLSLSVTALLALNGCVTIPNTRECYVPGGKILAGMDCADSNTGAKSRLTYEETIAFIKAGAVCRSSSDFNRQKTALEEACRILGMRCSYETRQIIEEMSQ